MRTIFSRPGPARRSSILFGVLASTLGVQLGCAESRAEPSEPPAQAGPFKSLEAAANAPSAFSAPRAAAPLADGSVVLLATLEAALAPDALEAGERIAVLKQTPGAAEPALLYSGDQLVNPLDLAVSVDSGTIYIADPAGGADGSGAVSSLSSAGGEPTLLLLGYSPRAITVAEDGRVFFSGVNVDSGQPGVFELRDGNAISVFEGAPFVDPSGIAVHSDGNLLVADTRLFDGSTEVSSEAGIVRVQDGRASILASGFATGYPAGIALTRDEKTLLVSGEGPDRSDTVFLIDVSQPEAEPRAVRADFSRYQDASAGLKRAHDSNTFIWASLAADGGTVFRIVAN